MIRLMWLALLFVIGVAVAAIWAGQMHHLRRAIPDELPGWTKAIGEGAGVLSGQASWPASGARPALMLRWDAKLPGADGMAWDLRVLGQGVDIKSELVVPFWPARAMIRNGSGGIDLAQWPASGADPSVEGLLSLEDLDLRLEEIWDDPSPQGTMAGTARGIEIGGADLGAGPITAAMDPSGDWQVGVALAGGVTAGEARLSGTVPGVLAQLDLLIADVTSLPDQAAQALSRVGQAEGAGLRLRVPLPLN